MSQAVNAGFSSEIINLAVGTGTWNALTLTIRPNNLLIRLREAGDLKISLDPLGATYFTIPDGTSLTYDWNAGKETDILYLQGSVSGTAEIIATYE
jgi:hypothetical protein